MCAIAAQDDPKPPSSSPAIEPKQTPARSPFELPIQVRTANQELYDQAKSLIDKVRAASEKLSARGNKLDDVRGKSDAIRKEIVDQYRAVHRIGQIGEELLLRGERDGETLRLQSQALQPALDAAVAGLRPVLGSPQGLVAAVTRRAKDQLIGLRQVDDLIKQKKWTLAYTKLQEMLEAADELARFPEAKDAEQIYKPIQERLATVNPEYFVEEKARLVPSLREEFAAARPDLGAVRQKLAAVAKGASEKQQIRWDDKPVSGPACLLAVADAWPGIDQSVAEAAAVAHAIGSPAETDLKTLQSDYESARVLASTLVRELIDCDKATLSGPDVEKAYLGYLDAIPRLMSALNGTPDEFLAPNGTALGQLAAQFPALDARVANYRASTDEVLRWRRRLVQRQLKKLREQAPAAEAITKLLDHPPPLPGQEGPAGLKRVNQMFWTPQQPPEFVASVWGQQWKDVRASAANLRVLWREGTDPRFVSPWHRLACTETEFPRQTLVGLAQSLSKDLLVGPNQPPLTLEVALLLHTATYGPYPELSGAVSGVAVENLSDRLWDKHGSFDVPGSLAPASLVAYPAFSSLTRLEVKPAWIAHDLFVWYPAPAPSAAPPKAPPPASQPVAAAEPSAAAKKDQAAPPPTAAPDAPATPPAKASAGAAPVGSSAPAGPPQPPPKKIEPPKPAPKGGVPF